MANPNQKKEVQERLEKVMRVGLEAGQRLKSYRERVYSEGRESIKIIRQFKAETTRTE